MLLALANAGGVIGYVPLLTLLLPVRMAELAGPDRIGWLAAATLGGAIAASLANLAFGWASDTAWSRRRWAATGLCLTLASYVFVHEAASPGTMVAAVVLYQVALNMLLAALAAWTADAVPDRRTGVLGGLLAAGQPIGALAGVIATAPVFSAAWMRLAAVCAMMLAAVVPVLLSRTPRRSAEKAFRKGVAAPRSAARTDFALLWTARLLVQVAGSTMFGFLVYYFATAAPPPSQAGIARLAAIASVLAFPIALWLGLISDRNGRGKPFLAASALMASGGLAAMGSTAAFSVQAAGFVLFACSSAVFLPLHASYAMQRLPSPARRGRDLGILNLANTIPSVIAPVLTLWLVPEHGFALLLGLLAVAVLVAGVCVLLVRS